MLRKGEFIVSSNALEGQIFAVSNMGRLFKYNLSINVWVAAASIGFVGDLSKARLKGTLNKLGIKSADSGTDVWTTRASLSPKRHKSGI